MSQENVLRSEEGYLNKSHYQYAEAVFTSEEKDMKRKSAGGKKSE